MDFKKDKHFSLRRFKPYLIIRLSNLSIRIWGSFSVRPTTKISYKYATVPSSSLITFTFIPWKIAKDVLHRREIK